MNFHHIAHTADTAHDPASLQAAARRHFARRIWELCQERDITPNALSRISHVPQATIKSILNDESKNPGVVTIKKLCEGFNITLGDFFGTEEFEQLERDTKSL